MYLSHAYSLENCTSTFFLERIIFFVRETDNQMVDGGFLIHITHHISDAV